MYCIFWYDSDVEATVYVVKEGGHLTTEKEQAGWFDRPTAEMFARRFALAGFDTSIEDRNGSGFSCFLDECAPADDRK